MLAVGAAACRVSSRSAPVVLAVGVLAVVLAVGAAAVVLAVGAAPVVLAVGAAACRVSSRSCSLSC